MCFSAGASFAAGASLSVIGLATLQKTKDPSQKMFAAIPLVFATQQLTEGVLWFSLTRGDWAGWAEGSTYAFLFFAQIVWPVWVPLACLRMETEMKRIRALWVLSLIGILISLSLGFCLLNYGADASVERHHILYDLKFPKEFSIIFGGFYVLTTVLPPFFSSLLKMKLLGSSILFSYIITNIFFSQYLISVWCYFAAVLSMIVYYVLYENHKMNEGLGKVCHRFS